MNVNDLKTAAILNNREPMFFILSPTDDELDKLGSDKAEEIDSLIYKPKSKARATRHSK